MNTMDEIGVTAGLSQHVEEETKRIEEVNDTLAVIAATEEVVVPEDVPSCSAADIAKHRAESGVICTQLGALAAQADTTMDRLLMGDNVEAVEVAQENLQLAFDVFLRSTGAKPVAASLESAASPHDRLAETGNKIKQVNQAFRKNLKTSLEDMYDDNRRAMVWLQKENTTLRQAIRKATTTIKGSKKAIDATPVTIDHQGVYFFLTQDNKPVTDMVAAINHDLDVLKKMLDAEKVYSDFYGRLVDRIKKIGATGKISDAQSLLVELVDFDLTAPVKDLIKQNLLFNGVIWESETDDQEYTDEDGDVYYEGDSHFIIDISYTNARGDGSKASVGQRLKSGLKGALLGGGMGAVLGMAGGVAPTIVVGAGVGAVTGSVMAVKGANSAASGANTHSQTSVDELVKFLEACEKAIDIQEKSIDLEKGVYNASKRADDALRLFATLIDSGSSGQSIVINTGSGTIKTGSNDQSKSIDAIVEMVREKVDAVYAVHMSLAENLTSHAMWLSRGGLMMAKLVLEQVK